MADWLGAFLVFGILYSIVLLQVQSRPWLWMSPVFVALSGLAAVSVLRLQIQPGELLSLSSGGKINTVYIAI